MGGPSDTPLDPRSLPQTTEGLGRAWSITEDTWASTFERARQLPEPALHEGVNGEWSFVETQRHLIFVTDAWVRRTILGNPHAYHRLGLPPDHRVGELATDTEVRSWGIEVGSQAPLAEVLEVRAERMWTVRQVVDGLTPDGLHRICALNQAPGFPPMTALPFGFCLKVVVGEEWAHHEFATRDLAELEGRR